SRLEDVSPLELDERCATEVDVSWRVQAQARVMVFVVVPAEEALAERAAVFDRTEAFWELRSILERLKLRFGIRVVVRTVRTGVALGDAQIGEEQGHRLGRHGRASIGMDRQLVGHDGVFADGLPEQALG